MRGSVDMSRTQEQGTFKDLPAGEYFAEIVEVKEQLSKNGDDMPAVKMMILTPGFEDCWVWDNITLSNNPNSPGYKILGRSKHFLHCIGQPYEGEVVEFDTDDWYNRQVRIKTDVELPNEYHKYNKPIVAQYILDESLTQGKIDPSKGIPVDPTVKESWGEEEGPEL